MADHADHLTNRTGVSIDAPSHEIGDFHLFTKGDNLVFSVAFNPTNRLPICWKRRVHNVCPVIHIKDIDYHSSFHILSQEKALTQYSTKWGLKSQGLSQLIFGVVEVRCIAFSVVKLFNDLLINNFDNLFLEGRILHLLCPPTWLELDVPILRRECVPSTGVA